MITCYMLIVQVDKRDGDSSLMQLKEEVGKVFNNVVEVFVIPVLYEFASSG